MQKRLLPHIAAVLTFALLTVIYFLPLYQGQTLNQGDVTQWEGMSKEIVDWNKAHPSDPALWTNVMFGGMPAILISQEFTGNFIDKVFHVLGLLFPGASFVIFLTMLGFYILLLCLDVNPWLSLAGALAYGFSSFTIISMEAGHNTKIQAMSMMAPVLGAVILTYRRNILLGSALTALFLAMTIDSNHLQVTYYVMIMLGATGVFFFVTNLLEKKLVHFAKATGMLIIAAGLAFLPNAGNLWSTQEYGKETIRGGTSELTQKKQTTNGGLDFEYASRWSYGFLDGEILTILIPDAKGGSSGGTLTENSDTYKEMINKGIPENQAAQYIKQMPLYWGGQPFTSGPVYFGAAIVFLFLFSMLIMRNKIKWLFLALTIFSMLLSFGHNTPFFKWMFDLLPFFNKFRTPAMALVIAQLIMPLTALLGLSEVLSGQIPKDELLRKLKIAGGIIAGIVIVFGVLGGMFFNFSSESDKQLIDNGNGWLVEALKKDRANLLRDDAFRSLFFIAASFGLLWFFIKDKLSKQILIGGLAILFLLDGWTVAKRYLNSDNFVEADIYKNHHTPSQADQQIMQDTTYYRVFNTTGDMFNEANTSYFHKSVGGYHAAKLIRYQDLIENQISKNNMSVLDMLNTKYFIVNNKQTKQPMAERNPGALGNAWFVHNIKWVKNADEEMAALNNFDPANTAIIDERYKNMVGDWQPAVDSTATIKLTYYSPNVLTYLSNTSSEQLAVFSEIYYEGNKDWISYIDGKKVDHFRADYVLRAMKVPAGEHKIEFHFEPKTAIEGNRIDYAGSFLLFAFVLLTLGFSGYKKMKEIESEPEPQPKPVQAKKPATPATKQVKRK